MKLPNLERIKIQTIRTVLLALMIYMVDRAITALVCPGQSEILQNAQQSQFVLLELFQLDNVTNFVSNSILFPLLLVIQTVVNRQNSSMVFLLHISGGLIQFIFVF